MPWFTNRTGERLWYEDAGNGLPVILLHGWCMSSAVWKYQYGVPELPCRLLAPDLRGHGRSRGCSGDVDFNHCAADLVDLCEQLDLTGVVLVGWSMGAQVVLQAYGALEKRLAGLVLVSATPRFTAAADFSFGLLNSEAQGMKLKVQRHLQRALSGFHTRLFAEGELEAQSPVGEIAALLTGIPLPEMEAVLGGLDSLIAADMRCLLGDITVPVLIIHGDKDRICLPDASAFLNEKIHNSIRLTFAATGHVPFMTQHQQFNRELDGFIRSVCEQKS